MGLAIYVTMMGTLFFACTLAGSEPRALLLTVATLVVLGVIGFS